MSQEIEDIVTKAHELFMKFGIKSVSMDDIARELGVSKRTLYQHVSDKNELVLQVVDFESRCLSEKWSKTRFANMNAIEEMIALQKQVVEIQLNKNHSVEFDLKKYYPAVFKKLIEKHRVRIFESSLENMLKGKKEGFYRDKLNAKAIAMLMVSRAESNMEFAGIVQDKSELPTLIREVFEYHLRGICSKKGLEFLENNIDTLK